ncbi:MAG: hypothetical protein FGF48_11290, partial [Candidatus Brockarchaeota archaeon]|nr:hypothetical protein [Candidatus Brockarchaeota archaeon]
KNQTISTLFVIDTGNGGEGGLSLVEGALRSLKGQIAGSLDNVNFSLSSPYQLWGVLCYPEALSKTEKEVIDIKNRLAELVLHTMSGAGLEKGFVTIEPIPFGETWRLYGFWRGIDIKSIRGITV